MRKTFLFVFALLFATASMAQNRAILLQESFDGSTLPAGWSISSNNNNWSVSATTNAGGAANEMKLDWSPQFNGTTRLVTPPLDLTGINSVVFSFKHALDNYQGSNTIGIATSSDSGANWNIAWSQGYNTSSSWLVNQEINTPDMGQPNVLFCIYFSGSSYNINDWYFDDIVIFTLENLDLGLESATLPVRIGSGETTFGINVFNYGATTVTSVQATYQVDDWDPVTETFEVEIPSLGTETLTFETPEILSPGNYNVAYNIDLVNGQVDDVADNNTLEKEVYVSIASAERIPMIEHFSSSTCGPCVSVNNTMLTFCNNNPGRFTYTKYQMNWPGSGDPYYTAEGGVRRDYYGVNAVPQCFLDGEDQGYAAVTQEVFDAHALRTAFMDIRGFFTVSGNTINVNADIMSYVDAEARVYISVNEKETHNNVGGNGETSFHHVFMKMWPDGQGSTVQFNTCELQHIDFTQDMSGTHVEEMNDLEVSIWVQDYDSKEIFNSRFAYENLGYLPPVSDLTLMEDEGNEENTMVAFWTGPGVYSPHSYNVYVNGVLVEEGYQGESYAFPAELGVFYVVGVQVYYPDENVTSVTSVIGKEDTWSADESEATFCRLYPNPANSQVRVEASNPIERVTVYNLLGAKVETIPASNRTVQVSLSKYPNGVYFFNVLQSDGTVSTQRVVVSH